MKALHTPAIGLGLGIVLGILASVTAGGADRAGFLPPAIYKELVANEVRVLKDNLQGIPKKSQLERSKLAALMVARFSLDAEKHTPADKSVESAALSLAEMLKSGDVAGARRLAAILAAPANSSTGQTRPVNAKNYLGDVMATMDPLRPRSKGGDGIHTDLQTSGPLKALNGIEEKIRSLAKKKLSPSAMDKSSHEMVLLGYRMAVLAEVIGDLTPADKAKEWRDLAGQMHSAGIDLARASQTKNTAAVHTAGERLNLSCERCHEVFRK